MTEHTPDPGNDETQRLPHEPSGGETHRYAGPPGSPYRPTEDTRIGGLGFSEQPAPVRRTPSRPGKGAVAAILVAALVVGLLGGLAGAAAYTLAGDVFGDGTTSASASPDTTSASVVDRGDRPAPKGSVEQVAASVLPSVVKINVRGGQGEGSGSGIVISSDGEILTNNHVVQVAEQGGEISVSFNDGTAKKATVVGTDPVTDLAVIKAEDVSGLRPARIGKSGNIDVGENVVAVGSPFGLEATVTSGIVSALSRPVSVGEGQTGQDTTYPAIQTDAAINPGNSGGPLVDLSGDVIGINSSIRTASSGASGGSIGLGFAIPIDNVWPIVQQLRAGDTPTHAQLGVSVTDASSNDGLLSGAGIEEVNPDSAADKAGLKRGDVVTKVDDEIITGSESLVATVRGHRPGDKVRLTVVTGGDDTRTVQVTLDSDEGSPTS